VGIFHDRDYFQKNISWRHRHVAFREQSAFQVLFAARTEAIHGDLKSQ
jgi:hypothetical protein